MDKLNAVKGILENIELQRCCNSYKNAPAEERVARLESTISALWAVVNSK